GTRTPPAPVARAPQRPGEGPTPGAQAGRSEGKAPLRPLLRRRVHSLHTGLNRMWPRVSCLAVRSTLWLRPAVACTL
ncbi:MAG: hypothetical protein AVDCRST_MAG77-6088, partial [uncultured Chloroflexi bacterium]